MNYFKSMIGPAFASIASVAYAAGGGTGNIITEPTNVITSASDVTTLLCAVMNWMFWGLIVLAMAMFLIGGYNYATGGDNPQKVSTANKILLYAVIALVVGFLAKTIPVTIGGIFGVSNLSVC